LRAPSGAATRPTADRVRQGLFEVLGDLRGARVVDLYAGSGALGVEALSRGAESVVFVESAKSALKVLHRNLAELGLEPQSTVLATSVERAHRRVTEHGPYDVVLCDPPWPHLARAVATIGSLFGTGGLDDGGIVTVEHPKAQSVELAGDLRLWQRRQWGGSAVSIFLRRGR
jgi:16S rRNA (guanine(966)-N(2))-methyltransferase RsmD